MDRYGGRVAQSYQYFQNVVDHFHHEILLFQPILLLNQDVVGKVGIRLYQIKFMENDWHKNVPEPNRIELLINKLV